jgi:uncharacterized protein YceH (UPF0502 family)
VLPTLDPAEVRVLGCLMEKQVTTPDVYPMTVNALLAACNQTTNRFPVVRYAEGDVTAALTSLRGQGLTRIVYSPSNRAPKHRHVADEVLRLAPGEQAALCVLLLRGPQTVGEVKGRTERLHDFDELGDVETALDAMAARDEPLVVRLPRLPGQKDSRYAHLLSGPIDTETLVEAPPRPTPAGAVGPRVEELERRVGELDARLAALQAVVERLRPLLD